MMTDPIADLLTRIRNANLCRKELIEIPSSKMKIEILKILEENGFIDGYVQKEDNRQGILQVRMRFTPKGDAIIHQICRVSKPSRRNYIKASDITPTHGGMGISILSTSQGIMTADDAKRKNIGGELLCQIW